MHEEFVKMSSKLHFIKLSNKDALTELKKEVHFEAINSNGDNSFFAVSRDNEVRFSS